MGWAEAFVFELMACDAESETEPEVGTSAKNSKLSHSSKTKPIAQIQVGAIQCFLHECSSIISF